MQRDFLELAHDGEIVPRQERVKILEDKNRRLDLLDDLVERGQRVLGGGVAILLRLDGGAGRDDAGAVAPFEDLFLAALAGDFDDRVLGPRLLAGNDVKDRVTRADEQFEFGLKVHRINPWPGRR